MNNEKYQNREISWLLFNERVLEEAEDQGNPVLERIKFASIFASNLDEFFMIRVSGLKDQITAGYFQPDYSGLIPLEQYARVGNETHQLNKRLYRLWDDLKNELSLLGYHFVSHLNLISEDMIKVLARIFTKQIYPVITPMAVDPTHPFPFLYNKTLNILYELNSSFKERTYAIVPVPGILPRFFILEESQKKIVVFIEQILSYFGHILFPGFEVVGNYAFRITRNADLSVDEEGAEDLLKKIQDKLKERRKGIAVRIELEEKTEYPYLNKLLKELEIRDSEAYYISGPIDLSFGFSFYSVLKNDLKDYAESELNPIFNPIENIFEVLQKKDILLYHPYESFRTIVDFLNQAANDPRVLAIKQTLYRTNKNHSQIVENLIHAAEKGKQVTVLLELKARFDEEMNIGLAHRLEEVGCHVIYGIKGLKTHAKTTLVVRKEENGLIKRYMHFGTGNYNEETSRIYTDVSFFTSQEDIAQDSSAFLNYLTGYSVEPEWKKISISPDGIKKKLIELIDNEIKKHTSKNFGRIIAKMNALVDPAVIDKLYEASCKGVEIDLIVRGICCLKPGVKGLSENIRVISIVGKFLEHSRIFYFKNAGEGLYFISSADWMTRNLDRRVEIMIPIESQSSRDKLRLILESNLKDNQKARVLINEKYQRKIKEKKEAVFCSQEELIRLFREFNKRSACS